MNPFGVNTPAPLNRALIAEYTAGVEAGVEDNRNRPTRETHKDGVVRRDNKEADQ